MLRKLEKLLRIDLDPTQGPVSYVRQVLDRTTRESRRELETLLEFLRPGDTLVVTRIDRLARSVADLQDIVRTLKSKSVSLKATDQPIDTASAAGKAFLDMLGVFAEFETSLRKERQMEGIAKAKAAGVYKGGRPSIDVGAVIALKSQGKGASLADFWESAGQASIGRPNRKCAEWGSVAQLLNSALRTGYFLDMSPGTV
jgi:DNA invertase Pin-like site-specific DNA recombinase